MRGRQSNKRLQFNDFMETQSVLSCIYYLIYDMATGLGNSVIRAPHRDHKAAGSIPVTGPIVVTFTTIAPSQI
jgi:hypothetical protein